MNLTRGSTLGRYEILDLIGKGGMGEVYLARDTQLGREVAIKTSDERFGERFQREARVIASLSHSNICTLYDVGPNYLVMELVEGPTLAERLKEGAIPLEESLNVMRQIAAALEAAHERGVVHRDLKPGNIKIQPNGVVKVLDFGLAKAMVRAGTAQSGDDTPTVSIAMTEAGMILGTAAYMSPEQARGKNVDKRADIWSFGVVCYEMLTGTRLFEGETTVDVLAQVVNKEPDWQRVPDPMRRLLQRCLQKDPNKRLRDISGAELLLETTSTAPMVQERVPRWVAPTVLVAMLAVAGFSLWAPWRRLELSNKPLVRLDVDLGSEVSVQRSGSAIIISPDDTRIVYVSKNRLFTRRLDQEQAMELPGTEGASAPFFSPDGKWVGFYSQARLKKISVEGGSAVPLSEAAPNAGQFGGGSWGQDGNILAAVRGTSGIQRISASGEGKPQPITQLKQGENFHAQPQILPGGNAVLFTAYIGPNRVEDATIQVQSLTDGARKIVHRGGYWGRYIGGKDSGFLVFKSQGALFAIAFDPVRLETRGTASPVLIDSGESMNPFDVSASGTAVYRLGGNPRNTSVVESLDALGNRQLLLKKPGTYQRPRLSQDGRLMALTIIENGRQSISIYEPRRGTATPLTFSGDRNDSAIWTPDGQFVIFMRDNELLWTRADGSRMPERLLQQEGTWYPYSITADGKRVAYFGGGNRGDAYDIYTVAIEHKDGSLRAGKPEPFLTTPADERYPYFSPDGKWIAYSSNEAGVSQVYVRAFPDKGGHWPISIDGGIYPIWSRGAQIFFRTDENQLMTAAYSVRGDSFEAQRPQLWSKLQLAAIGQTANYDVSADGKRVVAIMQSDITAEPDRNVTFLFNFLDEVRRRVAAANAK